MAATFSCSECGYSGPGGMHAASHANWKRRFKEITVASLGDVKKKERVVTDAMRMYVAGRVMVAVEEAMRPHREELKRVQAERDHLSATLHALRGEKREPKGLEAWLPTKPLQGDGFSVDRDWLQANPIMVMPTQEEARVHKWIESMGIPRKYLLAAPREDGPGIARLDLRPKQLIAAEEWPDELDLLCEDAE